MFSVCSFKKTLKILNKYLDFLLYSSGLPHGKEKSGKTKKNDKSQVKIEVLEKVRKKKNRFCQYKFTKFFIFKSLQIVKNLLKIL